MKNNNNLEMNNILQSNVLAGMYLIIEKYPDVIFGGSIALNAYGLIEREIKDIDIWIDSKKTLEDVGFGDFNKLGKDIENKKQ